jgi:fibronectin type 3 domain-containing protein
MTRHRTRSEPTLVGFRLVLLAGIVLGLACGDNGPTQPNGRNRVTKVIVTAKRAVLAPGDTVTLNAQVFNEIGEVLPAEPVTWSSSTSAVAAVDGKGVVRADSVGATTITATARGVSGSVDVEVEQTVLCDCLRVLDSTEITLVSRNDTTGIYLFRMIRGPPPVIDSGSILAGAEDGGYLRKVVQATIAGDLITVLTTTAYVEEAVRDGAFATTVLSGEETGQAAPGSFWWGPWTTTYLAPGVRTTRANLCCTLDGLALSLKFGSRLNGSVTFTIQDGEIVFDPRIDLRAHFGFFRLNDFRVVFRGDLGLNLDLYEIKVTAACCGISDSLQQKLTKESVTFITQQRPFAGFIGPMPVVGRVITRFKLEITPTVSASAVFTGTFKTGFGVTAGAQYERGDGWSPISGTSSYFTATAPQFEAITGSASLKIAVVPELFVEFYGAGGPFVNLEPYAQADATLVARFAGTPTPVAMDWETKVELGLNLNLGLRLSLLGLTNLEAAFAIPLVKPYRLVQGYSDGPLTVRTVTTGRDAPGKYQLRLTPAFTPLDPPLGRSHATSTQQVDSIGINDTISLQDIRSGPAYPHVLRLTGVQGNCTAFNGNPDSVVIRSGLLLSTFSSNPTDTVFTVDCIPLGDLTVGTTTIGPDAPARYRASVARLDTVGIGRGQPPITIGVPSAAGDTTLEDFVPANPRNGASGLHQVTLDPGRRNCAVARPETTPVVIQSGDTVTARFEVRCVRRGFVRLRPVTADPDPWPTAAIRYLPQMIPADPRDTVESPPGPVDANDSSLVDGLIPVYGASGATGNYRVALTSAPNRCREAAGFARQVTVFPADTAFAQFAVQCVERLHIITRTSGPGTDLDEYGVVLDRGDGTADTVRAGLNDTLPLAGVAPGVHAIQLIDVEPSCLAPAPAEVGVSATDSTQVVLGVTCPAPAPPAGLAVLSRDTSRIDLGWNPAGPDSVIGSYRVYRNGLLHATVTDTTFGDAGLPPFTAFTYAVSAVNRAGLEGARSLPLTVRTRDATPPTPPTGLVATPASGTRINLAWQVATDAETGVTGYRIYRDGAPVGSATTLQFADLGLSPSTSYRYRVSALNGEGLEGPPSGEVTATTLDVTPPTSPTGLLATAVGSNRIDLSWAPGSDPESGVSRYEIIRNGTIVGSTPGTSYSDGNLHPGTTYTYVVAAVNGAGLTGAPSEPATATTESGPSPPSAPSDLDATPVSTTRIELTWTAAADPESGIAQYLVFRDGALIDSTTDLGFSDTGLTPATTYRYEASAVNGDGVEGPPSTPAVATTPPVSATGDLLVHTSSSGKHLPQSFWVEVAGGAFHQKESIPPNGSAVFQGLLPGVYSVRLKVGEKCSVAGDNPRDVQTSAGTPAETTFTVSCGRE